jgi:hypothetical protein
MDFFFLKDKQRKKPVEKYKLEIASGKALYQYAKSGNRFTTRQWALW